MAEKISSKKVVLEFLNALNKEDFEKAKSLLSSKMKFDGVLEKRNGSDAYIEDIKK